MLFSGTPEFILIELYLELWFQVVFDISLTSMNVTVIVIKQCYYYEINVLKFRTSNDLYLKLFVSNELPIISVEALLFIYEVCMLLWRKKEEIF